MARAAGSIALLLLAALLPACRADQSPGVERDAGGALCTARSFTCVAEDRCACAGSSCFTLTRIEAETMCAPGCAVIDAPSDAAPGGDAGDDGSTDDASPLDDGGPVCAQPGESCSANIDCCSGVCECGSGSCH